MDFPDLIEHFLWNLINYLKKIHKSEKNYFLKYYY